MPTPKQIKDDLWSDARQTVSRYNFTFSQNCERPFRDFIGDGVNEIVAKGYINDKYWVDFAKANLNAFTIRMVIEARANNLFSLDLSTFLSVRELICPLWPFCT